MPDLDLGALEAVARTTRDTKVAGMDTQRRTTMRMRSRPIPLYVSSDIYTRLERLALSQDRDPIQQARFFVRQGLERAEATLPTSDSDAVPALLAEVRRLKALVGEEEL